MNIVLIVLVLTQSLFAIISISPVEIGDNAGLHTKAKISLNTKRGSADVDNYSTSLKVTYDNNISYVMWVEVSYDYGEVNKEENTNKLYLHTRYIREITNNSLRFEIFIQQEIDKFKSIDYRSLAGVGLRYKLLDNTKSYVGVGGFSENITYTSSDSDEKNIRLNSYFAYKMEFDKDFTLSYTLYYQPKVNNFNDYVTTSAFEFLFPIREHLSLEIKIDYDIDSKPPSGVNKDNFSQTTSFIFSY